MARPLPSDVFRLGDALDPLEKLVTLALLDYGPRAFPAQQTLAVKCGLSRRCIQNVLERLRQKGVVTTSSTGKALTYVINLRPEMRTTCAPCCAPRAQEMRTACASDAHHVRRDPNESNGTSQPNQQRATPAGGWGSVSQQVIDAVRQRVHDADAKVHGQRRGVEIRLREHKVVQPTDVEAVWKRLVIDWAFTGREPFDGLERQIAECKGARDMRALLLHRLRGAA